MCVFWDNLIKDMVWGSESGKKALKTKLRHRWVSFKPQLQSLVRAKDKV